MKFNHTANKTNFIRTDIHTNVPLKDINKNKLKRFSVIGYKEITDNPYMNSTILYFKGSANKFQAIIDYIDSLENH